MRWISAGPVYKSEVARLGLRSRLWGWGLGCHAEATEATSVVRLKTGLSYKVTLEVYNVDQASLKFRYLLPLPP